MLRRLSLALFCGIVFCGIVLLSSGELARAQEARRCENLLPKTTVGFVALSNPRGLIEHWEKTQLGQLMADEVMRPFVEDLKAQVEKRRSGIRERFGITLKDLRGVPGGEMGLGVIRVGEDGAAIALLIDVTGHLDEANALLKKVTDSLKEGKAKRSELKQGDVTVIQFDLPKSKRFEDLGLRKAFYFLHDNLLVASDHLETLQGILGRMGGNAADSLADVPGLQAVLKRCTADAKAVPQIRWYVEPIGYVESIRARIPKKRRRRGKPVSKLLRNQGFSALEAIGGFADLSAEGYEFIHRSTVYAPKPETWDKAMKMLKFPNGPDLTPQDWVARDVAAYATGYVDILNGFDNFGPLFDEIVGQGEEGIWAGEDGVLDAMETDPEGPQINLRKDLIEHLGPRVTLVVDYNLPITPTSERFLFAIETKDPQAVAAAVEKLMQGGRVKRQVVDGHVIWEVVEHDAAKPIRIKKGGPPRGLDDDEEEQEIQLLPHRSVTVAKGHLFVASHLDFLVKVLEPKEAHETLARSPDFRMFLASVQQFGIAEKCALTFARTEEEYRPTYELIRQGKMPQSEMVMGRVLNALLDKDREGDYRRQRIDGKNLPEFNVVRRYLGPGGMVVASEPDGWFIKGIVLSKKSP